MTGKTCALTGHRSLPENFDRNALFDRLEELIVSGYDRFLCGMASGFDLSALHCLIRLKGKYALEIHACIPFSGQEKSFSPKDKTFYRQAIGWCSKTTVLFQEYRDGCYLARDRYMVDRADTVFAYCMRDTGGTAYTVRYAEKKGIPVIYFR